MPKFLPDEWLKLPYTKSLSNWDGWTKLALHELTVSPMCIPCSRPSKLSPSFLGEKRETVPKAFKIDSDTTHYVHELSIELFFQNKDRTHGFIPLRKTLQITLKFAFLIWKLRMCSCNLYVVHKSPCNSKLSKYHSFIATWATIS